MTTAHKIQVALFVFFYIWLGWFAWSEIRAWMAARGLPEATK
jgi:hypothetical protein